MQPGIKVTTDGNSEFSHIEKPRTFNAGGFKTTREMTIIEIGPHGECILERKAGEELVIRAMNGYGHIDSVNSEMKKTEGFPFYPSTPSAVLSRVFGDKFIIKAFDEKTTVIISSTIVQKI